MFDVFCHAFIEPGYSWHLPPRHRTESVNTHTVVFANFPTGSLSSEMFSICCHTIQVPNAFQLPGGHDIVNVSIVLALSENGLNFAYFMNFEDTA